MRSRMSALTGLLAGVLGTLLALLIVVLVVVYTGSYNIAATQEHSAPVRWAFTTTMEKSVKQRAEKLKGPSRLTDARMADGAREYKAMCQHCHGGPGIDRESWATGMRPTPPELVEAASEWETKEIYWIVKHGIKMAGMPAFGPDHGEETLWNIAGFVSHLPAMTEQEYAAYEGPAEGYQHSH